MFEIFNQENFKNISMFDNKKILDDLSKNINTSSLLELSKHYLILSGFKNKYENISLPSQQSESFNYLGK